MLCYLLLFLWGYNIGLHGDSPYDAESGHLAPTARERRGEEGRGKRGGGEGAVRRRVRDEMDERG